VSVPRWYQALFRLYPPSYPEADRVELAEMAAAEWERAHGMVRKSLVAARLAVDHMVELGRAWLALDRTGRKGGSMDGLRQDVRYAWRALVRTPGFLAIAVGVIGLGIAATSTITAVGRSLLFRPPAGLARPDELFTLHEVAEDGSGFHSFSYPDFRDLRDGRGPIEELAGYAIMPASVRIGSEPRLVLGFGVTGGYFEVVGTRAVLGRVLTDADDAGGAGAARVAVMSHSLWSNGFGADSAMIGRAVTINGEPFIVVGVTEPGFRGHTAALDAGLWVPLRLSRSAVVGSANGTSLFESRGSNWLEVLGRASGLRVTEIEQRLSPIATRTGRELGLDYDRRVDARRYSPMLAESYAPALGFMGLLLLLAVMVLMIAGTNVAGIMVARTLARSRETAIRLAVGASRSRLVRYLVTESLIVFGLGGVVGIAGAWWLTTLLGRLDLPVPIPVRFDFHLDAVVLGIIGVVTVVAGLGFGLVPAVRATRAGAVRSLKDDGALSGMVGGRQRLRSVLVVSQVAASALLVVLAGFFGQALGKAAEVEVGFDPVGVQAAGVELSVLGFSPEATRRFVPRVEATLAATVGIVAVGATDVPPLGLGNQTSGFEVPGREATEGVGLFGTDYARVTPGYFAAMGIDILRGRGFAETDGPQAPAVAIINETLAERVWPGMDPVGQTVRWGRFTGGVPTVIVGVARAGKYRSLGEEPRSEVYLPMAQAPPGQVTFVARSRQPDPNLAGAMKAAIQAVEPNLPLASNVSYVDLIGLGMLPNRIAATLATAFGLVGLVLATLGLYGILSYLVVRRRKEIGVRIALGAPTGQVRRLVLREGAWLAGIGLAIGVGGALLVARLVQGLLFGIDPFDPLGVGGPVLVLAGAALLACDLPARRAAATQPLEVLRHD
jgi:predicted permease